MNPELRRNFWLQFSLPRLIIAPLASGMVLLLVWLVTGHSAAALGETAKWLYLLIVLLWGTRRAADLIAEEVAGGTWDGQRMSALGAWQMTWGKFLGGISYVWYAAAFAFAALVWAQGLLGIRPWRGDEAILLLHLLGIGVFGQVVAFLASLVVLRKQVMRRRLGVTLSQFAGLAASATASGPLGVSLIFRQRPAVDWFGWHWAGDLFALVTLALFLAWSLFGAYRQMRIELQFRSIPWAWMAFALFLMAYAEGLLYAPIVQGGGVFAAWLTGPFVIAILFTYAALFLEPKDVVRYRWLWAAVAAGESKRALTLLPQWIPVFLLAALGGFTLSLFGGLGRLPDVPILVGPFAEMAALGSSASFRVLPVAIVLCLLRDALVVLYFNFGPRRGRADFLAFIYLALAYFPVAGVLLALGATSLLPLVTPYPAAPPLISIGAPLTECVGMGLLVLHRARAAGRFKPAAA